MPKTCSQTQSIGSKRSTHHSPSTISFAVKEQCIVLFPYNAVNDDELTLEEGQIITIVSKDVEDKGWWKGEIDGKVGVFPVSESVTRWSI